jgi:hypothetical protein
MSYQVRRKTSFVWKLDSSESCTSPRDSIYEAQYLSNTDSDELSNRSEQIQKLGLQGTSSFSSNAENIPIVSMPESEPREEATRFLYGNGTILDTITEKNSNGTMRSMFHTRSADDIREMKSFPLLAHKDSMLVTRSPRRKQSFSVDDINLVKSSYHEACSMIERKTRNSLSIHEIYASPKVCHFNHQYSLCNADGRLGTNQRTS